MENKEIIENASVDESCEESLAEAVVADCEDDKRITFAKKYLDLTIFPKSKKKVDVSEVKAVEKLMEPSDLNSTKSEEVLEYGKKCGIIRGGLVHATQDRNF